MRTLQRRRTRERAGRFVAEGIRVVEDLLASPLRLRWAAAASSLEDGERGAALAAALRARGVPLRRLSDAEFSRHAATDTPQGVLAVADAPHWPLDALRPAGPPPRVVLVLDAVQDPGNFGTLVRSAEALGAAGVIALPGSVDPWNPKTVRAAMGSTFRLPVVQCGWAEARAWLREHEFRIYAAAVGGAAPRSAASGRSALVLGNEGAGVSAEVLADADRAVGIPLRGRAESLNVAAAAAILLYEFLR